MKRKKLLLISLDALCESDFETVRNLPNFSKIITEGAYCPHVNAVYPSLTFPCHTSIATGCTPDTHRIVNNYVFDPYAEKPSWNFYTPQTFFETYIGSALSETVSIINSIVNVLMKEENLSFLLTLTKKAKNRRIK